MNQAVSAKAIAGATPVRKSKGRPSLLDLAIEYSACGKLLRHFNKAPLTHTAADDYAYDSLYNRRYAIEDAVAKMRTKAADEAIAHCEIARENLVKYRFAGRANLADGDAIDRLALSAIDNALRALRAMPKREPANV